MTIFHLRKYAGVVAALSMGHVVAMPVAPSREPQCQFSSTPVEKDLGTGLRSWVWNEPYNADLFQDGLWLADAAYEAYTAWLNITIPRDFGGLDPFDQRECLKHQRHIFKTAGFSTHDWDIILNGTVGGLYQMNCIESLLWAKQNEYHPQKVSATEFGAYILLDDENTTIKVKSALCAAGSLQLVTPQHN